MKAEDENQYNSYMQSILHLIMTDQSVYINCTTGYHGGTVENDPGQTHLRQTLHPLQTCLG